ncbi:MAG TPA: hypothetical protein DCE43_16875 [Planctomycetaceae bacterium]|nr:hypothetical protein [Planctomycetaceae bacterium]
MSRRWPQMGLPLLTKELIEQAARKRTYVVRLVYASLLFVLAFWQFTSILSSNGSNSLAILGSGTDMFHRVIELQSLGILLFLPALACGAITSEKERDSLTMLLVTRLGPFTILMEKLLSRLVPMFSFLLLSLPLLAFAYSLGGVSTLELVSGIVTLLFICIHVGALAIMCSSWCGSTVAAFVSTYTLGLLSCPFLILAAQAFRDSPIMVAQTTTVVYTNSPVPIQLTTDSISVIWIQMIVLGVPTVIYLALARFFLIRRAHVIRRNLVLRFFRQLDRFFFWLNDLTTGGVILVRDDQRLPEDQAITWRETQKKTLGTARYLIRVLVSIETPLFLVLAIVAGLAFQARLGVAAEALYIVWALSVLLITVHASSLLTSERSHQTLDLVLASPMTSREIILEKHRGIRRLIYVLSVPLLTIYLFESWFAMGTPGLEDGLKAIITVPVAAFRSAILQYDYSLCSLLSIVVYLPLCSWIALWIGIKSRSQVRAMLLTLFFLFGWAFLPSLIATGQLDELLASLLKNPVLVVAACLCSPSTIIVINENAGLVNSISRVDHLWYTLINFAVYGLAWSSLRRWCLAHADRLLGRRESTAPLEIPQRGVS